MFTLSTWCLSSFQLCQIAVALLSLCMEQYRTLLDTTIFIDLCVKFRILFGVALKMFMLVLQTK
jgi:hypothetical protein